MRAALEIDRALQAGGVDGDARRTASAPRRGSAWRGAACWPGTAGRARPVAAGRRLAGLGRRWRLSASAVPAVAPAAAFPAQLLLRAGDKNIARRSARSPTARWRGWCSLSVIGLPSCRRAPHARAAARPRILSDPGKRQLQRRAPSDQHIIMTGACPVRPRKPHDFAQPAADPVALDRIADLLRHGKAEACRSAVGSLARLQHEPGGRRPWSRMPRPENPPVASTVPWKLCARGSWRRRSGGKPLASARAPRRHHFASALGGHARAETVTALAYKLARLVGPLHD